MARSLRMWCLTAAAMAILAWHAGAATPTLAPGAHTLAEVVANCKPAWQQPLYLDKRFASITVYLSTVPTDKRVLLRLAATAAGLEPRQVDDLVIVAPLPQHRGRPRWGAEHERLRARTGAAFGSQIALLSRLSECPVQVPLPGRPAAEVPFESLPERTRIDVQTRLTLQAMPLPQAQRAELATRLRAIATLRSEVDCPYFQLVRYEPQTVDGKTSLKPLPGTLFGL